MCIVKGRVRPEYRVRSTLYHVKAIIGVAKNAIKSAACQDCAASLGGCKHTVAFLMWLYRRSEELSSTSTVCYWKKTQLSRVGSSIKYIKIVDMGKSPPPLEDTLPLTFNQFLSLAR